MLRIEVVSDSSAGITDSVDREVSQTLLKIDPKTSEKRDPCSDTREVVLGVKEKKHSIFTIDGKHFKGVF